jgi:hypothetical protein
VYALIVNADISTVDLTNEAGEASHPQKISLADGSTAATLTTIGAHDELDRRLLLRERVHHSSGPLRTLWLHG